MKKFKILHIQNNGNIKIMDEKFIRFKNLIDSMKEDSSNYYISVDKNSFQQNSTYFKEIIFNISKTIKSKFNLYPELKDFYYKGYKLNIAGVLYK